MPLDIGHGMAPTPLSNDEITNAESDSAGLNGNYTLAVIPASWDFGRAHDSWAGPFWKGRSGSGGWLAERKQDMVNTFDGTGRRFALMYSITPQDNGNYYQPAIDGDLDSVWLSWAQKLIDNGMEDTILRPNPEHNYDGLPRWPADSNGTDLPAVEAMETYADAFARLVSVVHDASSGGVDANFDFLFSPIGSWDALGPNVENSWPPNSAFWPSGVDPPIVCPSYYDSVVNGGPSASEWDTMTDAEKEQAAIDQWESVGRPRMENYRQFAVSENARFGLVEWGPKAGNPDEARGDNPWFVELMLDYLEQHDAAFECMWSFYHADGSDTIMWIDGAPDPELDESWDMWTDKVVASSGPSAPDPDADLTVRSDSDPVVPSEIYVNQGGTAAEVSEVYVNDGGTATKIWPTT